MTEKPKLLRILGLTFGLSIVVGGMIGVGILRTPGIVASNLGSFWPVMAVWLAGGIYALVAVNSYAELGTLLPKAGGPYVFAREAYGDFGGLLVGWSDWLLSISSTAYIAVVCAEYAGALFRWPEGSVPLASLAILVFFTTLHLLGLRYGARAQELTSALKLLAFAVLIVAAFVYGGVDAGPVPTSPLHDSAIPVLSFFAVIISMQFVVETYAGYESAIYFSEENTDSARNIPRALFGGVLLVTVVYLLVNAALFSILSVGEIGASKLPAADAADRIFGETGSTFITALSLLSLLGILNAITLQTPRILFAISRDGLLPEQAGLVDRRGTPRFALCLTMIIAAVLAADGYIRVSSGVDRRHGSDPGRRRLFVALCAPAQVTGRTQTIPGDRLSGNTDDRRRGHRASLDRLCCERLDGQPLGYRRDAVKRSSILLDET